MAHRPKSASGDWTRQLRFDMAFAEKTLLKDGYLGRIFVVHTKDQKLVIPGQWDSDRERGAMLEVIKAHCLALNAEALSFISEAWARHLQQAHGETNAEFRTRVDAVRPRDAEDRVEVVIVLTMFRDDAGQRQVISDTREIERRANGKPSGLKAFRLNEGWDVLDDAVVDAFPEFEPSRAQQHAARVLLHLAGMGEAPQ
jgi:hypothetical protein